MSAYMIFNYRIDDTEAYAAYPRAAMPTLRAHGAEVVVADYATTQVEGEPGEVTVVLRFESREAALGWYESEDYRAAIGHRTASTTGTAVLCDGFVMPGS